MPNKDIEDHKLRSMICPVCGRAILNHYYQTRGKKYDIYKAGKKRIKKYKNYKDPDSIIAYYDYLTNKYDMYRDYIAVEGQPGRAGLKMMTKITKDKWEHGFNLLVYAVARAIRWWVNMKWIKCEDICNKVKNFDQITTPIDNVYYISNFTGKKILPPTTKTHEFIKPTKRLQQRVAKLKSEIAEMKSKIFSLRYEIVKRESALKDIEKLYKKRIKEIDRIDRAMERAQREFLLASAEERSKIKRAKKIKEEEIAKKNAIEPTILEIEPQSLPAIKTPHTASNKERLKHIKEIARKVNKHILENIKEKKAPKKKITTTKETKKKSPNLTKEQELKLFKIQHPELFQEEDEEFDIE